MAGQTTLTAAFVDDIFSLVLLVLLRSLAAGSASTGCGWPEAADPTWPIAIGAWAPRGNETSP